MNAVNASGPKYDPAAKNRRPSQAFSRKQRALLAVVPPLATLLLRVLCFTLRFETRAEISALPADHFPGPDIYAFWHRCLLLAAYQYRNLGIRILISQSLDGELIARIVQRLGFVPVRGSSSRGGAAGLLALSRALAEGHKVAITVDGPKGPRYIAKPGAASVALRQAKIQQQHISPFYLSPSRCWTLHSWDRFIIPKPFSRVTCFWTIPVEVSSGATLSGINADLQAALDRAAAEADAA